MDGKTFNALTGASSSQACNICKVSPKDINNLDKVLARASNVSEYKFGISILHAYLRCFEYVLHIAYNMDSKQWQARGDDAKNEVKERKRQIINSFHEKMGFIVDQPKQGGGYTNDGNTARKYFANPSLASEVTGLKENLIRRFANILVTISSGHNIKKD
nr:unnamed protein product [Callosobruchus analis]